MKIVDGRTALANHAANRRARWNVARTSNLRSDNPQDAANRIHDGFADIDGEYRGPKLTQGDGVFAMGSCFAREIERHLRSRGANVLSVGEELHAPVFLNAAGKYRDGFFNRFNPMSLWQEFAWCFDALDGWGEETLVLPDGKTAFSDLNYWTFDGAERSHEATMERRRIARANGRRAAEAKVVIVTLGMTEAWFHKPSGFYANRLTSKLMARRPDDFDLRLIDHDQTVQALEDIWALLRRVCATGVQLVVTVSPVPLDTTFTDQDIVVANAASKATLRAAAAAFCDGRDGVSYFPSYELAMMSKARRTWRADRIHVHPALVAHIVERFAAAYYETGALATAGGPKPAAEA
jgi:hypothetical protein